MSQYSDILVATDGSETAERAVDHAGALADGIDDTLYVLSVADSSARPMAFGVDSDAELEAAVERTAAEMDDHASEAEVKGAIRQGSPADEIVEFAAENDVDAIVLGRSGHTGLADQILGSTADRVVRRASRPVVLVPPSVEA